MFQKRLGRENTTLRRMDVREEEMKEAKHECKAN